MAAKKKSRTKSKSMSRKKTQQLKPKPKSARKKQLKMKKKAARSGGSVRNREVASKAATSRRPSRSASSAQESTFPNPREEFSGKQSGDLQGLSTTEDVDSESIDELAGEGNAFEADVLQGVEDAEGEQGKEVRTHEVPEDDVPDEYLKRD